MYKILVVDDEELIRKGLISRLDYNGFKFEKIIEASNGREALELIEKNQPHIVITDVRMPQVDGIELIRSAKDVYPNIHFVIISGYAEFEYAEQALNMGVSGYILKPIGDKHLIETLNRVIKDLSNQSTIKEMSSKKEVLEKYYESITLEQRLNEIIHNTKIETYIKNEVDLAGSFQIAPNEKYVLALVNIDGKTYYQSQFKYQDIELVKFAIENITNEILCNCKKIAVNNYKDTNQIIIILTHSEPGTLKLESDKFFSKVINAIEKYLNFSVTAGISKLGDSLSNELYRQANEALQQRVIHGNGEIYRFEDIGCAAKFAIPKNELGLLEKYIERCDVGNIEIIMKSIFSNRSLQRPSVAYIRFIWTEIMKILIKVGDEMNNNPMNNFDISLFDVEVLNKFDTLEEIISYTYTLIIDFLKLEKVVDINCKNKVKMSIQYIEQHYQEDITVNDLAYMYAISPNYFSTVFKKETNKTVVKYITEVRVKNACKLLLDTKASVVDISNKVGYQDTQYFFRVFKKITGKTPLEFRKDKIFS